MGKLLLSHSHLSKMQSLNGIQKRWIHAILGPRFAWLNTKMNCSAVRQSGLFYLFPAPDTTIVWPTKWASRRQDDRWRTESEMSPTEQQAGEHRLHNNEFLSTVQPARLLICGRGWLRDNASAPCAARQLLHKRILLPWQKRDGEARVVIEGQFVQHEETGFIRL